MMKLHSVYKLLDREKLEIMKRHSMRNEEFWWFTIDKDGRQRAQYECINDVEFQRDSNKAVFNNENLKYIGLVNQGGFQYVIDIEKGIIIADSKEYFLDGRKHNPLVPILFRRVLQIKSPTHGEQHLAQYFLGFRERGGPLKRYLTIMPYPPSMSINKRIEVGAIDEDLTEKYKDIRTFLEVNGLGE